MKEILPDLKNKLSRTPEYPGVYLMKNKSGKIIYVGKANSLRKRLSSYFQSRAHDTKVTMLVKNIADFEYIITDSEVEALILESTLIKKHKPKYNISLKDDKRYPYITVTLSEKYPRILITRKLNKSKDRFFGPYTDTKAARSIVSIINSIFKLRLCNKQLPLKSDERPCLNFQMQKCSGLCRNKISEEEYLTVVNNAISFLEGKIQPVQDELNKLMNKYSDKQEYENAARIRDIIHDMRKISQSQKVFTPVGADKDYIGIQIQSTEALIIIFEFRNGVLLGRKISVFDNIEFSDKDEIIKSFLMENYKTTQPPMRIILQYNIKDVKLIEKYLISQSSRNIKIATPGNSEDRGIINLIQKNLDVIAVDRLAYQKLRDKKRGLLELKSVLNLESLPEIIECFDISNTQGTNAVASMVRFKQGIPDRNNYRKYKIKAYDSPNDPAMIHEALGRRLQYLINEDEPMPDLFVIDGGKTQLNRALELKEALEINVKIISIAKRYEEIFTADSPESIMLSKSSPALKIIQNIRDEAHRFAITYHKKLRAQSLQKSVIDSIPNVGDSKKKLLLKHIGSVEKIKKSTIEELSAIPGIGEKTAQIIYNYFNNNQH